MATEILSATSLSLFVRQIRRSLLGSRQLFTRTRSETVAVVAASVVGVDTAEAEGIPGGIIDPPAVAEAGAVMVTPSTVAEKVNPRSAPNQ